MGCQSIMHKPCGWHNVEFIISTLQRRDRQNNPDSVIRPLQRVQAIFMKMNKRGICSLWLLPLPLRAEAFIFMGWKDSSQG